MGWNEPGSNGKDPWDNGSGPPDLEELLKKFRGRFRRGPGGSGGTAGGGPSGAVIATVVVVGAVLWGLSGFYTVQPAERGVVLQFGEYLETVSEGLHWRVPWPVQTVEKVNVDSVRSIDDRQIMLTKDENIVDLDLSVQYKVREPDAYLFNVRDPDATLRQALKSALREIVGRNEMTYILTEGREGVAQTTKLLLQSTLDGYETGLDVTEVNIKDAQPPESVQGAFADAIKAREDEQRLINEAEAYASDVLPRARGQGARMEAEGEAYKARVEAEATGDASRFLQLLAEYQRAPKVTRDRLYLDTMREVMGSSSKILIDVDKSSPLLYLPLDQMMKQRAGSASSATFAAEPNAMNPSQQGRAQGSGSRTSIRDRGRR